MNLHKLGLGVKLGFGLGLGLGLGTSGSTEGLRDSATSRVRSILFETSTIMVRIRE